ncbi:acyl-CoA thioesterase [Salmonella enterica subsp. enterica]|nr:acyl-CoA thioesterase [Salmonella enterica subsp. enterica]
MFRWPIRVCAKTRTPGGVVYHASYVAFMKERARNAASPSPSANRCCWRSGSPFVVRKMTLEYYAPARLDDMLEVQTEITSNAWHRFGFHATHCPAPENTLLEMKRF